MKTKKDTGLESELKRSIQGDVLFDEMSKLLYSTDASLYQMKPRGVVLPRNAADLPKIIEIAARHQVSILPRGGGTSLAGQTVTDGIVVDCSKYMNRILEVNEKEGWARVQPGIILDNLNHALQPKNLFFAPDVATSSRANVGGMIGNNSAGVRSVKYGKTVDHVLELRAFLSNGEEVLFRELGTEALREEGRKTNRSGEIHRRLSELIQENHDLIESRFPKVMRRVSGYNLDELLDPSRFNLAKLLVGSEGTLAFITEAKIHLEPIPAARSVGVLHFHDLKEAIRAVEKILEYAPSAVEILDHYGLELARSNPSVAPLCRQFIQGDPDAVLLVEFSSAKSREVAEKLEQLEGAPGLEGVYHLHRALSPESQNTVWQVRKNALGVMLSVKGDAKPLPFIEDSAVPVEHLPEYVSAIQEICRKYDRQLALYAHASVGVIHLRPLLNLKEQEDVEILQKISEETFEQVRRFGGSWSGEHGDGLVRSYKIREFFGDEVYELFRATKRLFDPEGLMNPGKILEAPAMTEHLRIHPGYRAQFPPTYYRFAEEGGFDRAVEMCTGVGQCRKTLTGTMCPSYMATRDEEHSTRGRANALRSAMAGDLGPDGMTSHRLFEVLDLCLECKACKSECPSSVDMAKMKAEFLAHYYDKHGLPLGKRLVARTRLAAEWASRFPTLANALAGSGPSRWLLEKLAGIDRRRRPPRYAKTTLTDWYRDHYRPVDHPTASVVLFADTFVNFYEPQVGIAAVEVLHELGIRVEMADVGCCGRPLISSGLLEQARDQGSRLVRRLQETHPEVPVLTLEPSCFATMKDDYPDLIESGPELKEAVARITTFEEYLSRPEMIRLLREKMKEGPSELLFHGHCQQKALIGSSPTRQILETLSGCTIREVPDGCCGMAGVFGYEKDHYDLSKKIGSRHLLPMVESSDPDQPVVVSGFSCRSQIAHFTGRESLHPAEILRSALKAK